MACRRWLLALLLLAPVPAAAQTTNFLDQCTSSGTEPITTGVNHTIDIGVSWAEGEDTGADNTVDAISSTNTCAPSASDTSDRIAYTATPLSLSSADYSMGFQLVAPVTGQTDLDPVGTFVRWQDADNWYACLVTGETSPQWVLLRRLSGTTTLLDSGSSAVTTNSTVECLMAGDTLKVLVDSMEEGCVVDTGIASTGQGAIGWGNYWPTSAGGDDLADTNSAIRIDNITLLDWTGEGQDDNCGAGGGGATGRGLLLGVGE